MDISNERKKALKQAYKEKAAEEDDMLPLK